IAHARCQSPEQPSSDCRLPAIVTLVGAGVADARAGAAPNDRTTMPAINERDEAEANWMAARMGWCLLLPNAPGRSTIRLKMRGPLYHTHSGAGPDPLPLALLRAERGAPAGTVRPGASPGEDDDGASVLACAGCLQAITTAAARTAVAGAHEHTFTNPAGFQLHLGCFPR